MKHTPQDFTIRDLTSAIASPFITPQRKQTLINELHMRKLRNYTSLTHLEDRKPIFRLTA